jgi:hypothetical protein
MRPPNQARPSRRWESAIGSGNSRRSTPKSRKMALLPEPNENVMALPGSERLKLKAEVLEYPGGMPSGIGFILTL